MIKPSRVVFDENKKSAEVTLLNSSESTKVYHILWEEKRQKTNGSYVNIDMSANDFPASTLIRHSPRKITIKPGEYQKIKLRAKIPEDLTPGEYRSHLMMKVVNDLDDPTAKAKNGGQKGAQIVITPRISFTIPIMIRKGPLDTQTEITRISVNDKKPKKSIDVTLEHEGKFSSYGNLYAYMKADSEAKVIKIGESHNIALFRETKQRIANIPLQIPDIPRGAVVQVLYKGEEEFEGEILGKAAIRY